MPTKIRWWAHALVCLLVITSGLFAFWLFMAWAFTEKTCEEVWDTLALALQNIAVDYKD